MKKGKVYNLILLVSIIILTILFQGCSLDKLTEAERIVVPQNKLIPISGSWEIYKYKVFNNDNKKYYNSEVNPQDLIGEKAVFTQDKVMLLDEVCKNVKYKIKNINSKDYFYYTYKEQLKDLNVENKNIKVVSVTSEGKLFYDFIKIHEDEIIVHLDNIFYYLKKVSDNSSELINKEKNNKDEKDDEKETLKSDKLNRTGVLIGLRSNVSTDNKASSKGQVESQLYRTIWISSADKNINNVLELQSIYLPRISGFWNIQSFREKGTENIKDNILAFPLHSKKDFENTYKITKDDTFKKILFIGSYYMGIECTESYPQYNVNKKFLKVLPIDNLQSGKPLKISDITGESGKKALIDSSNTFLDSQNNNVVKRLEKYPREDNFTLVRKNGHWIMRGRLESNSREDHTYYDFNINMIVTNKMITYDDLSLSWNSIKERVPDAKDAYTSPNKDIAIILNDNYIYIYGVKGNIIENKPIKKLQLKSGEKVIMTEWATGDYVGRWNKQMEKVKKINILAR